MSAKRIRIWVRMRGKRETGMDQRKEGTNGRPWKEGVKEGRREGEKGNEYKNGRS